jgi:hypothetical protein
MTFPKIVFEAIKDLATPHCRFECDPVCGGDRMLSLFRSVNRSFAERYCQPDCLMVFGLRSPFIPLVFEIDEASEKGLCPKDLAGKPHAANMCRYLIDPGNNASRTPIRDAAFVQIVNTAMLPPRSWKPDQHKFVESDINANYLRNGSLRSYSLIGGRPEDFVSGAQRERLRGIVKSAVFQYELLDRFAEDCAIKGTSH